MTPRLAVLRPGSGEALVWLREGWRLFKQAPVAWMGMSAFALLAVQVVSLVPLAGVHLIELLSPLLVAGYMAASRAAVEGRPVTFLHLGAGYSAGRMPALLTVGGIYLLGSLAVGLLMRQVGGEGLEQLLALQQAPPLARDLPPEQVQAVGGQALPALFIGMVLLTPLVMATWFAPALALFDGFSPVNSLWWSMWACAVNWRPLLLYSLALGVIGLVAFTLPQWLDLPFLIPLVLMVFLPVAMISTHAAYRSLFAPRTAA